MKIIDSFLEKEEFNRLQNLLFSNNFSWYYDKILEEDEENFQFFHMFYSDYRINSSHFDIILPILKKLNAKALVRIKANLLTKTNKIIEHGYHVDITDKNIDNLKTAVFYCNTNNGHTKFKDGDIVESIENRIAIFDAKSLHAGTSCTNEKVRIVLNFNYYS